MVAPEKKFSGEDLAEALDIPNGKYGTAGVLAWPGRYSFAVGRILPCNYEDGPFGARCQLLDDNGGRNAVSQGTWQLNASRST